MKLKYSVRELGNVALVALVGLAFACGDDDGDVAPPPPEDEEEVITDVTLTFTPDDGGAAVEATAQDPDGDGPMDLEITSNPTLTSGTTYTMTIELLNAEDPNDIEDITEEIEEEADEHMFFFAWTDGLFSSPTGDGNVDNRDDPVNYEDQDSNGYPLGLETTWTPGSAGTGTFQVILKHQPPVNDVPVKTATSTATDGGTDVDLTWNMTIN